MITSGRQETRRLRIEANGEVRNSEIQFGGISRKAFRFDELKLGWWRKKCVVTAWNCGNT